MCEAAILNVPHVRAVMMRNELSLQGGFALRLQGIPPKMPLSNHEPLTPSLPHLPVFHVASEDAEQSCTSLHKYFNSVSAPGWSCEAVTQFSKQQQPLPTIDRTPGGVLLDSPAGDWIGRPTSFSAFSGDLYR